MRRRDEHPPMKYRRHPPERWFVGRSFTGKWYAGPRGFGVYADITTRRRWIFFSTWEDAYAYARARAAGRP